jgi:hypothetical protein
VLVVLRLLVCIGIAVAVCAGAEEASQLYKEGRKAEKAGDVVRAYLLYAQAAALDPSRPEYWTRSQALRTRAAMKAGVLPRVEASAAPPEEPAAPAPAEPAPVATTISPEDLEDVRRLKPPPELKPRTIRATLDLRGDARMLYEKVSPQYGLDVVFDGDFQPGPPVRFRTSDADYREALHTLELVTGTFVVPISERLLLVARDSQQKRAELEPAVAVTIPIPHTVSVQEAQELARAIQQTMEIQKLVVDATQQMVLIRDRISKVRPAQVLFEQLAHARSQVLIEMQFVEIDRSALLSYGYLLPYEFPIVYVARDMVKGPVQSLAKFLFGHTILGLGIGNAELFANMTDSSSKLLMESTVRSVNGQPATFHVGDKYPIMTGTVYGLAGIPPTFNFEDLGLVLKATPFVHGTDEVTLDIEASFKVLAGSSINGIPIISDRKFQSKVRIRNNDRVIVAGLMTNAEARAISSLPGLGRLPLLGPLFRRNDVDRRSTEVVILLKTTLLDVPASETVATTLHVGTEGRLKIPL